MGLEHTIEELEIYIGHLEMGRTPEPLTLEKLKQWLKDIQDHVDSLSDF